MRLQKSVRYLTLFILAAALFSLLFTFQNAEKDTNTFNWVNHTHKVIEETGKINALVLDLESGTRGYIISGNPSFISGNDVVNNKISGAIDSLQVLISDNPVQVKNIARLKDLTAKKISFQREILQAYQNTPSAAIEMISSLRGKELSDSIKRFTQTMELEESRLLKLRIAENRKLAGERLTYSIIAAIVAFFVLLFALYRINKEILKRQQAERSANASAVKYQGLIDNSAVVIYTTDMRGHFTYISSKVTELTGYSPEELIGQHYNVLINDEWKEEVEAFYFKQFQQGVYDTNMRFAIVTKEGFEKWVEQNVVLLKQDGRPIGFQSIVKDITETKLGEDLLQAAEQQLRSQQEENQFRLQAILDNIPMIVYIKDLEGRFVLVNRHFKETFDVTDEMALGKFAHDISNNLEAALKLAAADREVMQTLKPVEIEDRILTKNGERDMLVTKFPLFDQNKRLFAVGGIDKDVTEMVRNRQQLIAAKLRAEQAEKLQEEFLANMSHEIRTPMNGIIGMTNLLSDTSLAEEQKEYVNLIRYSSETLHALINDILDLSKIKAGRMTIEKVDFNLREVVYSALSPLQLKAKEKGILFQRSIAEDVPTFVKGDRYKLTQVINNLVSNAVKFTGKGQIGFSAKVRKAEGNEVLLEFIISDTGIGIANEHLDQVFESFVQAGDDMVRRFGGTGLGLAITKRLIELQGGQIRVASELGKGSSFYFTISYQKSEGEDLVDDGASFGKGIIEENSLKGRRILLVEDNLVNQKVTYHLLRKAGLVVQIANDGREAIALLEEGREYDLIIMDLQMPEMNGFQTTTYIRQKLNIQWPIIAMTASALRNERSKCFEVGMNEYMSKPFVPRELFANLRRFLSGGEDAAAFEKKKESTPAQKLYDLSYVKEMDNPEYTVEILQLFLETTPVTLEEIKSHVLHENWTDVHKGAHKLKSSLGVLQMTSMLEKMGRIEQSAKQQTELDIVPGLLKEVARELNLIQPMLQAELEEAKEQSLNPLN